MRSIDDLGVYAALCAGRPKRAAAQAEAAASMYQSGAVCDTPLPLATYRCPFDEDGEHWHLGSRQIADQAEALTNGRIP